MKKLMILAIFALGGCAGAPDLPATIPDLPAAVSDPAVCEQTLRGYQALVTSAADGLRSGCPNAPPALTALCSLAPAIDALDGALRKVDGRDCAAVSDAGAVAEHTLLALQAAHKLADHLGQ